jgi:LysM repeat protein
MQPERELADHLKRLGRGEDDRHAVRYGVVKDVDPKLGLVKVEIHPEGTPTPITYTVQADDTLQLISSYFSVSVGAMLQLNPGLSELSLVPGSKILVPPNG